MPDYAMQYPSKVILKNFVGSAKILVHVIVHENSTLLQMHVAMCSKSNNFPNTNVRHTFLQLNYLEYDTQMI